MSALRDVSFDDCMVKTMKDPVEAAAYIEAVLELDDPAALLLALRQVAKAHGMAEVARRADLATKSCSRPERKRQPDIEHGSQGAARCRPAPERDA